MNQKILYAGDTSLGTAAAYLAGVLTHFGVEFDYVASDQPLAETLARGKHALYVISDYPVNNVSASAAAAIVGAVRKGAGLLMIGGWESFHGAAGEYHQSPLADLLPVAMEQRDDRVNVPHPCVIETCAEHEILSGLPWQRPPTVGGYNRIHPLPESEVLLSARQLCVTRDSLGSWSMTPGAAAPLLVVGKFGEGRTAAFASDVAPHWVGGLVDWGDQRIAAQAEGAEAMEVGNHYAEFFHRLICWTAGQ